MQNDQPFSVSIKHSGWESIIRWVVLNYLIIRGAWDFTVLTSTPYQVMKVGAKNRGYLRFVITKEDLEVLKFASNDQQKVTRLKDDGLLDLFSLNV